MFKNCSRCKKLKPLDEYSPQKKAKDGRDSRCRECRAEAAKEKRVGQRQSEEEAAVALRLQRLQSAKWRAENPELVKERQWFYYIKHRYGITREQYEQMLVVQNGICAIVGCGRPAHSIDHDNACCPRKSKGCGKCVRGLLCRECNVMLGLAVDDPARLRAAADYLELTRIKDVTAD